MDEIASFFFPFYAYGEVDQALLQKKRTWECHQHIYLLARTALTLGALLSRVYLLADDIKAHSFVDLDPFDEILIAIKKDVASAAKNKLRRNSSNRSASSVSGDKDHDAFLKRCHDILGEGSSIVDDVGHVRRYLLSPELREIFTRAQPELEKQHIAEQQRDVKKLKVNVSATRTSNVSAKSKKALS